MQNETDQLSLFMPDPDHVVMFNHSEELWKTKRYLTIAEQRLRNEGIREEGRRMQESAGRHADREDKIAEMLEELGFDTYDAYENSEVTS